MSVVTRWWWIRHAPVTTDGGSVYGQRDLAADCSDRDAFASLARRLPQGGVWIVTHLSRTRQTAQAIAEAGPPAPAPAVEPTIERELVEQHFGAWQGQKRDELFRRHSVWPSFWLAPADYAPPGGESFAQVVARVRPAIRRLSAAHAGRDIVAVAHGGTIRAALALALDLAPSAALSFSVDNLSLTRLDHILSPEPAAPREAWRVVTVNEPATRARDLASAPSA